MKEDKKFMSEIDLNKSHIACSPCHKECKKINERLNKRKLEEVKPKDVPHLLKVFNF